jgi:acetylornithine deacetylase/succinyl-diaminopimelate desuccinylase-like protein
MSPDIRAAVAAVLPTTLRDLEDLVRIPSVSADPARQGDVARSAEATAALLRGAGLDDVVVVAVDGGRPAAVSYTQNRAHETMPDLV